MGTATLDCSRSLKMKFSLLSYWSVIAFSSCLVSDWWWSILQAKSRTGDHVFWSSYSLHTYIWCFCSVYVWLNWAPHILHLYGFPWAWTRMWLWKYPFSLKDFPQIWQVLEFNKEDEADVSRWQPGDFVAVGVCAPSVKSIRVTEGKLLGT